MKKLFLTLVVFTFVFSAFASKRYDIELRNKSEKITDLVDCTYTIYHNGEGWEVKCTKPTCAEARECAWANCAQCEQDD